MTRQASANFEHAAVYPLVFRVSGYACSRLNNHEKPTTVIAIVRTIKTTSIRSLTHSGQAK
jgi:hypothetical protein